MTKDDAEMLQSVTLTFADGKKATFTGPAVLFEGQTKVVSIEFGEPRPMPEGCSWGNLEGVVY